MREYLILPGYQGSGPRHWQTLWETEAPAFRRVQQRDWGNPDCGEWSGSLEAAMRSSQGRVVLVAHSLACLLVAHWAAKASEETRSKVDAAFLVGVVNPSGPAFPEAAAGFAPFPLSPLPFKSLVIASTNDPYGSVEFALRCSQAWESLFEVVGPVGHINAESGLGNWPEGRALLAGLAGN